MDTARPVCNLAVAECLERVVGGQKMNAVAPKSSPDGESAEFRESVDYGDISTVIVAQKRQAQSCAFGITGGEAHGVVDQVDSS
jgi:hypothetical protein